MLEFLILPKIHRVENEFVVCIFGSISCKRFVIVIHYYAKTQSVSFKVKATPEY
jgi:hypothetical protein